LQPQARFFTNLSYETGLTDKESQWRFDVTFNNIGQQRIPNRRFHADSYQLLNSQITKVFSNQFELYVGGENLTNVQQNNPILGSENPFGLSFDTTLVYQPIFGRSIYAGLRFKIK
jgi:hypothetical protein